MTNDKMEKLRRQTKFSIEGLLDVIASVRGDPGVLPPREEHGIKWLDNNVADVLGGKGGKVTNIESIHEGKHHRVYLVTLEDAKKFVLRIPYKLDLDEATATKIKSEAAVLDFLSLKLGASVPKVIAYAPDRNNAVKSPFILEEYIPGDLLMKQWNPNAESSEETNADLNKVILPLIEFQNLVNSVVFTKYGSLYFSEDLPGEFTLDPAYEGETDENLKHRWRVGPLIEQPYARGKKHLSQATINQFNGPWPLDSPLKIIGDLANLELENAKQRLAKVDADVAAAGERVNLQDQVTTFGHLATIGPQLLSAKSPAIMNFNEQFAPRLYLPDLDPLNVITSDGGKDKDGNPVTNYTFLDFEYAVIKPYIYQSYPSFIAYDGARIYDPKAEVEGFEELDELEKSQYLYMHHKTRNEHLWEKGLNAANHDLIGIALPHVKFLKQPYVRALEIENDDEHLFVEASILNLKPMWKTYVDNQLTNTENLEFPIQVSEKHYQQVELDLDQYQHQMSSQPFAATGGWIPQDVFDNLKATGIIEDAEHGNYEINTEKLLQEEEK